MGLILRSIVKHSEADMRPAVVGLLYGGNKFVLAEMKLGLGIDVSEKLKLFFKSVLSGSYPCANIDRIGKNGGCLHFLLADRPLKPKCLYVHIQGIGKLG